MEVVALLEGLDQTVGRFGWHRRPGHLTQGRFEAALVEEESDFWVFSRYVHLNPVRGKRPPAAHPADWRWSGDSCYSRKRERVGWVAYEATHAAWQGEMGAALCAPKLPHARYG